MGLVERDGALTALAAAWADARAGRGRLLLVEGEAGIGKTALVRRFAQTVDARVLWGGCEPVEAPRPLAPLHDFARAAGGPLGAVMASVHSRHESFTAALDLLAAGPTLAVVEDVHWADQATLDLLVFLARRITACPVLVVVTLRDDELALRPPLRRTTAALRSLGADRIGLTPLSPAGVAVLASGTALDPLVVHRVTGGHPFFVSEVLGAGATGAVPASVRDAVLDRVARLSIEARRAVEAAAVVPDRVELSLLYAISRTGPAAVAECEEQGLLESAGRAVRFRHELARRTIEESLTGARRQQLHQKLVDVLAAQPGHPVARVSHHADLAGDGAMVVSVAPLAAVEAARVGAHQEAADHLERALRYPDFLTPGEQADLLGRCAQELEQAGAGETAVARSERSIALWRSVDDRDGLAGQLARHSHYLWAAARPDAARAAAAEAVRVGRSVPGSRGLATALAMDAYLRMLRRDTAGAEAVGQEAIAQARRLDDPHLLARSLNAVGSSLFFAGRPAEGEALLRESLTVAESVGDDERVGSAMVNLGSSSGECRRYDVARPWLQRCHDWCDGRDLAPNRTYSLAWLARVAFEQGDWELSERLAAPLSAADPVITRVVALTARARAAVRRGRPAEDLLDAAWEVALSTDDLQRTWPVAAGRAEAAWLSGRAAAVPDMVAVVFDRAVAIEHPWAVGELGYWLWRSGQLDDAARRAVAQLGAEPFAAQVAGNPSQAAVAWDALGCPYEAALARYETDERDQLAAAVRRLDLLGARPLADVVAGRLRTLGGRRPPRPRQASRDHPAGLTARELEIAELVGEGLTNAEIGRRLHISTKTAGHHVSAILGKLGVTGRREIARALPSGAAAEE